MQGHRLLALALTAAGLMAYNIPAGAQTANQPQARAGADSARMYDPVGRLLAQRSELKITDQQASRLEAIQAKYLQKNRGRIEQLRRDNETRGALRASMDSARTEVLAVLTPEQETRLGEMRKKWREGKHGGRHDGRHGQGHGDNDDDDDDDDNDNDDDNDEDNDDNSKVDQ